MKSIIQRIRGIFQWIQQQDTMLIFSTAVVMLFLMRAVGMASFAVFLALIYIMYFVSVHRR